MKARKCHLHSWLSSSCPSSTVNKLWSARPDQGCCDIVCVSLLLAQTILSVLWTAQADSGSHPTYCSVRTGTPSRRVKELSTQRAGNSPPSCTKLKSKWSHTASLSVVCLHGAHSDSSTLHFNSRSLEGKVIASSVCLMFCTVRLSLVIVIHRVLHSVKTQRYGEFSFRIFLKVLIALSLLPVFVMNFYSNLLKK